MTPTTRETADHIGEANEKVVQTPMHRDAAKAALALKVSGRADHIGDATTMIDHAELAPCPFCGGEAERVTIAKREGVRCADVLCSAGSHRLPSLGEDAVAAWNRRTQPEILSPIHHLDLWNMALSAEGGSWRAVPTSRSRMEIEVVSGSASVATIYGSPLLQDHESTAAFIAAANPATVLSLLSEIAALRSAKWDVQHADTMNDMVLMGMARDEAIDRATQAERQRDEAVGLLIGLQAIFRGNPARHALMSWWSRAKDRIEALANQGADQ